MSHYICSSCDTKHQLFGPTTSFHTAASDLSLEVLGELPLVPQVSEGGDAGRPFILSPPSQKGLSENNASGSAEEITQVMERVARRIWDKIHEPKP
jgi:ATP-binding protein involved in chromosome partitioning